MLTYNKEIHSAIGRGTDTKKLIESWQMLQYTVAKYYNSETPGLPMNFNKPVRALA